MESSSCAFFSWTVAKEALASLFPQTAPPPQAEKDSASHHASLRKTLSLDSAAIIGSFASQDGLLVGGGADNQTPAAATLDLEKPEAIWQKGKDFFYRSNNNRQSPPPPPPREDGFCFSTFDDCFGVEEAPVSIYEASMEDTSPRRMPTRKASQTKYWQDWQEAAPPPPSRESTDVSSYRSRNRRESRRETEQDTSRQASKKPKRPSHILFYRPKRDMEEDQHLEVMWRRDCLDRPTRLVKWSGTMEASNSRPSTPSSPLSRCPESNVTSSSHTSVSVQNMDADVGWITCYQLQRGLTDAACMSVKDPVLNHFCHRFGLRTKSDEPTVRSLATPASLDQESLFHPYGSFAAQEELQHRLAMGKAPDGAVLSVADVLQSMPVFFVSDLFIDPEWRGSGLGLVLLDRACRRVADSYCMVVVFLRDYTDERLPHYLGLLGFSFLAPGFLMRRHGVGRHRPPRLDEVCPFLPPQLVSSSGGRL